MSEMIDRVALALAQAFHEWVRVFDEGQAEDLARAAIEAMRMAPSEPRKILRGHPEEVMQTHEEVDEEMFRKKWNARIDEALK